MVWRVIVDHFEAGLADVVGAVEQCWGGVDAFEVAQADYAAQFVCLRAN